MHKFNALRAITQSVTYTFSNGYLWLLMLFIFCVNVVEYFLYSLTAEKYPGAEYLFSLFDYTFYIWWFLVIAIAVMRLDRHEPCSLACCMRRGVKQLMGAWWLVAWLTLLSWAKNSLIMGPYLVSEGVDLIMLLIVTFLEILQLALNFFMLPEIADKNYAILHLYVHALDELRKNLFQMVQFFLMIFLLFIALALLLLILVYGIRVLTECVVICPHTFLMHGISKAILESGATTITLTTLVVAQTLFYLENRAA